MKDILFIKVNPKGTENLYLDVEEKELVDVHKKSKHRDGFKIVSKGAVSIKELHLYLEEYKPTILHISGHGSEDGHLYFHDSENYKKEVSIEKFCESIKNYDSHLRFVFLNACFSIAGLTEVNLENNQAIIGMSSEVPNDTAILFSSSFYASLFGGKTVENSFQSAAGVVSLDGFGEEKIPVMLGTSDIGKLITQAVTEEHPHWSTLDLVSRDNVQYAMAKRQRQKKSFYFIVGFVVLISVGLVVGSIMTTDISTWYSLIGLLPLATIKWLKDRMDTIDDSLMLLQMLQTEIDRFARLFDHPPVERMHERAAQYNDQFWRILETK